ncbi:TM0106 family RecB-like putative nuclease [Leucobacter salsicius]|uniref:TM0106 family RecB-like putative nuclease n=1 Tax=Leucobacter salsicius TaxID=664638 RepID=UPI00034B55C9|nr:bifunctional RecB family nuclease/DEAD/DEAH box helicase [Leucobacter salsicius]
MFVQQRAEGGTRLVTSASDLSAASACEFAFLRRVDVKVGRDVDVPPDDDAMLARAAKLGDAHEERTLEAYRAELGPAVPGRPGGVAEIDRPESMREDALMERQQETVRALQARAEVVFQATFFDPEQLAAGADGMPAIGFVGFADFLRLTPDGAYEVQDTKLARRAKVTALMQLAAYAEQLERVGIDPAPEAVLILGDGSRSVHRVADVAPVFRSRRARLHEILLERATAVGSDGRVASAAPVAWGAPGVWACGRCEVCEPELTTYRDPLLIAGMRRAHRDRLIAAGLDTIDRVAALKGRMESAATDAVEVDGISERVLERIVAQADVQVRAESGQAPPVEVSDPLALAALPEPNPGDLFFDFEGDPMYREQGRGSSTRWGLDYLFGMVDVSETFTTLWAHDLEAEKQALLDFLALVRERRARFPGLRIYHYAAYERAHLTSIAARHGVGEAEVDQLLREHVLVDLYPIVRSALRVGSRSYSIKKLEPLYMGDELRDETGVVNGAESVTEYAEATAQLASPDAEVQAEGHRRLEAIANYNRYDCVSTLRLRDWLLAIAREHGVVPYAPEGLADLDTGAGPDLAASATGEELLRLAELAAAAGEDDEAQALRLAASAIDYHQREQKSFWWAHFARLVDPIEDWADTRDVLVVDPTQSRVSELWHRPARARTDRRHLLLRGTIAPGSSLRGGDVFLLYAYPAPFPQYGAAPGARGARRAKVLERLDDGSVLVEETLQAGVDPFDELPLAIVPGPPPPAGAQKGAIEEWGRELAAARSTGAPFNNAVFELLRRVPPAAAGGLAPVQHTDEGAIDAVIASLVSMQSSALAVQGPPGTGKTYLASRVIRNLIEQRRWRIGVVAQSHKVVENVLAAAVGAGVPAELVAKVPQGGKLAEDAPQPEYTVLVQNGHLGFMSERASTGFVIGGTAWDFSNDKRFERGGLDLLVIDEAGQFSLAPTIAASVAADRLLLLGDPQQLPQVSQGSHPEPVDTSALGWLIGGHDTLSPELGYFLADTRRMRAELADVVSELSYEGRLRAHPSAASREVTGAGPAGLSWHPVQHAGNATRSEEEANEVVRVTRLALAGTLHEGAGLGRSITQDDIIVVAPYNAQVECVSDALAAAGLGDVRVGTVDKFQGQEAVFAIVTLAASSPEDVPRGLDFLLMRNRLNVGISRAQWAAHLVSSAQLGSGLPGNVEGLTALSGYLRLLERAH